MAVNLTKGQRISLDKGMKMALIGLGWNTDRYTGRADFDLDASAFLLGANGRVRRDEDFVFYGNLRSQNDAVVHTGDSLSGNSGGDDETLFIDFSRVPEDVDRIAITVTIYEAEDIPIREVLGEDKYPAVPVTSTVEELVSKAMVQNFVPVVDDTDVFIGIVTRKDIIKHLVDEGQTGGSTPL